MTAAAITFPGSLHSEDLDPRSSSILEAVIYAFVMDGKPVGSRTLSRKREHGLSPATIRNVMSDLEAAGYLTQPHPSAGRVPTDKGYRFYVDRLIRSGKAEAPTPVLPASVHEFEKSKGDLLPAASQLLADLTHHVGIVITPDSFSSRLHRVEFVDVASDKVLVVLVTESGSVHNTLVPVKEKYKRDELRQMGLFLTEEFSGKTLRNMRDSLQAAMADDRARYDTLHREALELGNRYFENEDEEGRVFLEGKTNIFSEQDLQADEMKAIFAAFEQKSRILQILNNCLDGTGFSVIIGSENPDTGLRTCSFILSSYEMPSGETGTLGIVGPTRMEYARMLNTVRGVADWLKHAAQP